MRHALGLIANTVLLTAILAGPARAGERYFVVVFGSQSHPKHPKLTHTWCTFLRVQDDGTGRLDVAPAEQHSISWLPATGEVRVLALRPEPGVNLDLEQTLRYVTERQEHVKCWGPFEVGADVYRESLRVRMALATGQASYRALGGFGHRPVYDCILAVAAVDPEFGHLNHPLIRYGVPASRYMARQLAWRDRSPDSGSENSCLLTRLGLEGWGVEIIPRSQMPPTPCVLCYCPE